MSKRTDFVFKVQNVLSWIIFIGLCVESGSLIVNAINSILFNPIAASRFLNGVNLYDLYKFNQSHFITFVSLLIIVSVLKSILFYLIVSLFHKKKLNLTSPFNEVLGQYIFKLAYVVLGIGIFTYWGNSFSNWLKIISNAAILPEAQNIKFEGAGIWLFMGNILIIVALIFKRGIELQSENDLTV